MLCRYDINVSCFLPAIYQNPANIIRTPHYPGEDEKLRASSISRRRGGNCPNTLEVLQQLVAQSPGADKTPLNLIAILPAQSSVASRQIREVFEPRVSLSHCIYRDQFQEPASSYIIKSEASGSRTIVNYNELPEMTLEEFTPITDRLGIQDAWYHFEVCISRSDQQCIVFGLHRQCLGPHTRRDSGLYTSYPGPLSELQDQCRGGKAWTRRATGAR